MATPNFAAPENASNYFAICMSYERPVLDDDGEETEEMETVQPDEWEVEDTISNLKEALKNSVKETDFWYVSNYDLRDTNNSYACTALGKIYTSKMYGDVEINLEIIPIIQSAYYEGATLDFLIYYDGERYDDSRDFLNDLFSWDSDMPKGMQVIQEKHANVWIENSIENISNILNKLFQEQAQYELVKTCQFSNGEAIYGLADNKRNELKSKLLNA